jgi:hypothetical protein
MSYSYINDAFNINQYNKNIYGNEKTKSDNTYSNYGYFTQSLTNNISSNNQKEYTSVDVPYAIEDSDNKNYNKSNNNVINGLNKENKINNKNLDIFNLNEMNMNNFLDMTSDNDGLIYNNAIEKQTTPDFESIEKTNSAISYDLNGTNLLNLMNENNTNNIIYENNVMNQTNEVNFDNNHGCESNIKLTHNDCINIYNNPEFFSYPDINFSLKHISKCNICKQEIIKNKNIINKMNCNANNTNTNTNNTNNNNSNINTNNNNSNINTNNNTNNTNTNTNNTNNTNNNDNDTNNYGSLYDTNTLNSDEYIEISKINSESDSESEAENILNSILLEKEKLDYFNNLNYSNDLLSNNKKEEIPSNPVIKDDIYNMNIIDVINRKAINAIINFEISFIHIISVIIIILLIIDIGMRFNYR